MNSLFGDNEENEKKKKLFLIRLCDSNHFSHSSMKNYHGAMDPLGSVEVVSPSPKDHHE